MEMIKSKTEEERTEKHIRNMRYYIDAIKCSIIGGAGSTIAIYMLQNKGPEATPLAAVPAFAGIALSGFFLKKYGDEQKKLYAESKDQRNTEGNALVAVLENALGIISGLTITYSISSPDESSIKLLAPMAVLMTVFAMFAEARLHSAGKLLRSNAEKEKAAGHGLV